jgi:DNA-binding CsgD family transcriptional regulator
LAETSKSIEGPARVAGADVLEAFASGVLEALEDIGVPAYIVDAQRRIRWQNAASVDLMGDLRGRLDSSLGLDEEDLRRVRDAFAQKANGTPQTEVEVSLPKRDGTCVRVAVNSVPLKDSDGVMVGSFGLVRVLEEVESLVETRPALSRRERETLTLLAAGLSTTQMAERMCISEETVRNHVKRVLRTLGARSRVEAVAKARGLRLV